MVLSRTSKANNLLEFFWGVPPSILKVFGDWQQKSTVRERWKKLLMKVKRPETHCQQSVEV